jgi:hypothetical protein
MDTSLGGSALDALSFEAIDVMENEAAAIVASDIPSNTKWADTSKHMMHNGSNMNCP